MTVYQGNIRKMQVSTDNNHMAQYSLPVGEQLVDMKPLLGKQVHMKYQALIHCVHCGRKTKKSFNQGYCYPCLISLAQCDSCIIKPELCHYAAGTCREPSWGEANCLSDHYVYLANTGAVKVGITRHVSDRISSRWIDQGATQALPILRVQNRLISGLVESVFKKHIADKTNWRAMLKGQPEVIELAPLRDALLSKVAPELAEITQTHGLQALGEVQLPAVEIHYPVQQYPDKVKSINLDKELQFCGTLQGIKGQYWLLDGDRVINMRKYAGYHIELETNI
jgi:hypothetical protein